MGYAHRKVSGCISHAVIQLRVLVCLATDIPTCTRDTETPPVHYFFLYTSTTSFVSHDARAVTLTDSSNETKERIWDR